MNFLGLEKKGFFANKLNRELTNEEVENQLNQKVKASENPRDCLNIIKMNGSCLEVVDKWFIFKGLACFTGGCLSIYLLLMVSIIAYGTIQSNNPAAIWFLMFAVFIHAPIFYIAFRLLSLEMFKQTHYPIRFDAESNKIHALLPGGEVVNINWNDAFVFLNKTRHPFAIKPSSSFHYEVCIHVLSSDRSHVLQTFSLGSFSETKGDAINLWEFVRVFMEDSSSHRKLANNVSYYLPIEEKAESFKLSVMLVMAPASGYPLLQLITAPITSLFVLGRRLSVVTSQIPKWPECSLEYDGEEVNVYRNENKKLTFLDSKWPLICFAVGFMVTMTMMTWGLVSLYYSL